MEVGDSTFTVFKSACSPCECRHGMMAFGKSLQSFESEVSLTIVVNPCAVLTATSHALEQMEHTCSFPLTLDTTRQINDLVNHRRNESNGATHAPEVTRNLYRASHKTSNCSKEQNLFRVFPLFFCFICTVWCCKRTVFNILHHVHTSFSTTQRLHFSPFSPPQEQ